MKGDDLLNRKKTAIAFLLSFSLVTAMSGLSFGAPAKPAPAKPAAAAAAPKAKLPGGSEGREAFFVTLEWVKDNLRSVVLLDARPASLYAGGHIPGAHNAEWQSFSSMKGAPGSRGWATLLAPKSLAARIGALGIDGTRPVIVYGEPGTWGQDGFVALTLRMAGVQGVRILDGGWTAWRAAGLPVTKEVPKPRPVNFAIRKYRDELNATVDHIRERLLSAKLLDVRTLEEYKGARYFSEKRGGHLPGAILVPYNRLVGRDGMLLPEADLKALFLEAGLSPGDEIIVYDTAGVRSAYAAWVLLMLGYTDVRNYDGSFHEWAGIPELSVETGDPGELPVLSAVKAQAQPPAPAAVPAPKPAPAPVPVVPPAVQSADAKPAGKAEAPATEVPPAVKSADQKPSGRVPIAIPPVSPDVDYKSVKPIPIGVPKVSPGVKSADSKPAAVAKILAIRWNRDDQRIRMVVDLDRALEPRVTVKPGFVELAFGAFPVQGVAGMTSPFAKEVSLTASETAVGTTLTLSHKLKQVRHFRLEKPERYVVDFEF